MEEVDSIILHFLRQLDMDINDDIKTLNDLPVNIIIIAISKCLSTINPSLKKLPQNLPEGISHRIEIASQLASMCKDLGYKNEVGYQTFLYSNESDLRKVFMFLIEFLPSRSKNSAVDIGSINTKPSINQTISNAIARELNSIWVPYHHQKSNKQFLSDQDEDISVKKAMEKFRTLKKNKNHDKDNHAHDKEYNIYSQSNDTTIIKETNNQDKFKSLKDLKEEVILYMQKYNKLNNEKNTISNEYSKVFKSCNQAETELKNIQNLLQNSSINLDDNVNIILNKLQKEIELLHRKSEDLTLKNITLKSEYDELKLSLPESAVKKFKDILLNLKIVIKQMKEEYIHKERLKQNLKLEYEKLSKGNKRIIYTQRILEIISNVDKQNIEIKKILEDTRLLQKDINTLEGQLDRCFSVADETLFADAKKDDQAKKAYKLLALLHSECSTIVGLVNDTGTLAREIVDLEDHIETERAKRTEETLKRIKCDITKLREENSEIFL